MTLAIVLNAVFVVALLALLAATMRLPFLLRSGDVAQARLRHRRVRRAHAAARDRTAVRGGRGILASD